LGRAKPAVRPAEEPGVCIQCLKWASKMVYLADYNMMYCPN
jgi:hypothetical protein